jgi:hypothetical protein
VLEGLERRVYIMACLFSKRTFVLRELIVILDCGDEDGVDLESTLEL